jgi:steroid 5-alpha reductase family enzyme
MVSWLVRVGEAGAGRQMEYPDSTSQPPYGRRNLLNALLVLMVPLPAVLCAWLLFDRFPADSIPAAPAWTEVDSADQLAAWLLHHPLVAANVFYFVFVNLVFWLIAIVQRSSWLIDPYWTLLPLLLAWFYLAHPMATPDGTRAFLACAALVVWSARLTYNYFRRERWRFGLREDWRYAKMRRERSGFWWEQFLVVHIVQHLLLVGLTLPFWAISFCSQPPGPLDFVAFGLALAGVAIAGAADTQLDRFMRANEERLARGEPKVWLLETGLWRYSRHPYYFGEQLFWWSIAAFGIACGEPWVVVGTLLNSCVLAAVTVMTERKIAEVPERSALFADYRSRTSVWIPWPPRRSSLL